MKRRRRPPLGVLRYLAPSPCPDCAATFVGTSLVHADTCPLSNAVEDQCDADAEYFRQHPEEWHYTREISWAELQTMAHLDPAGAALEPDHVHVLRGQGGRIRQFCTGHEYTSIAFDEDKEAS